MTNETSEGIERLSWLPDRADALNGLLIGGQKYYDVYFTGGEISDITLTNVTVNGLSYNLNQYIKTDSGNVTVAADDYEIIINKTVGQATTVTLPASPADVRALLIVDGKGDAGTNNITVDGNGNNINGSATFAMNSNSQSIWIIWNGTQWNIVGEKTTAGTGTVVTSGSPVANNIAIFSDPTTITGVATTGSGNVVRATSPTFVTPALGIPSSVNLTNATALPISTGVSGLGTNVATFLATPSSANLASAVTDETGTGSLVFASTPTLVTPILGTPTSGTLTNCTGLPIATGVSNLGTGVATFLATPSSANLASAVTDETGTGKLVFGTAPTFASNITVGMASSATGAILFKGTTSGIVTLSTADAAGTWTMKLPTSAGTNTYVLSTDGSGNTSWIANGTGGSPLTTKGDLYTYSSNIDRLPVGTNGQVLTADSTQTTGIKWAAGGSTVQTLKQSNVQVSHTGDTNETTLVDYTLPANTLPANGALRITTLWSRNSGGTSTNVNRVRLGGISGTVYFSANEITTNITLQGQAYIWANNSTSAQKGLNLVNGPNPYSAGTLVLATSALDMTTDIHIVFTEQLANSGDTGSLESYTIEMLSPP